MAGNDLTNSPCSSGLLLPVSTNVVRSSSPTATVQQSHLITTTNQKFNGSQTMIEDPRALQLALELAGLNTNFNSKQLNQQHSIQEESYQQQQSSQSPINSGDIFDLNVISAAVAAAAAAAAQQNGNDLNTNNGLLAPLAAEERSKKSQNMTECVPVPSSEHVAEIVGRQGCKIKALRAKTNTYIKTPVRNEEPVFVVTGRKEDVAKAKREILSAAEHFSLIRATRKCSLRGAASILSNGNAVTNFVSGERNIDGQNGRLAAGPPAFPGQITIYVRVPYRVVGLVVGPKGATIKHIQQETQTYIVTPSREKEPVFEVTGLPENVQTARRQIEAHIALRTGNLQSIEDEAEILKGESSTSDVNTSGFSAVHTINSLSQILNENINQEFLDSLYKNGICSSFEYLEDNKQTSSASSMQILKEGVKITTSCTNGVSIQHSLPKCNFVNNMLLTKMDNSTETQSNMQQKQINTDELALQQQQKKQLQQKDVFGNVSNSSQSILTNHVIMTTSSHIGAARSCSSASSTTSSKSTNNSTGSNSGSGSAGSTCSSRPELIGFWKNLGDSLDISDEVCGPSSLAWQTQTASKVISPTDSLFGVREGVATETTASSEGGITGKSISSYLLKCILCNKKDVGGALPPCGHNIFCVDCAGVNSCPMCNQNMYQQSSRPSLPLP